MKDHECNTDGMNGKTIVGSLFFIGRWVESVKVIKSAKLNCQKVFYTVRVRP